MWLAKVLLWSLLDKKQNQMNTLLTLTGLLQTFWELTALSHLGIGHVVMLLLGICLIFLAIRYELQPLWLVPIGFGILIGNIPFFENIPFVMTNPDGSESVFYILESLPSLIPFLVPIVFLGIGAMIDFTALIANPKLMLIGAMAQFGIFAAFIITMVFTGWLGASDPYLAGSIGIIGGANAPAAIFLAAHLTPQILGTIAIVTYFCLALTPTIQSPIMRMLTTDKERVIRMKPLRVVSQTEKILFPVVGLLLTVFLVPMALLLLGMLFFGNLLKESGVTRRLAETVRGTILDVATILLGLAIGVSLQAFYFLSWQTLLILIIGAGGFKIATCSGILFVKVMNLFLKDGNKINPLIGNAGVSAMPDAARTSQAMGASYDPTNYLLAYAKGASVAGLIGAAVAAGILLAFWG